MRLNVRSNVDLPQPEGPMSAVTCRSWMSRSTSRIACCLPYQKPSPRADSFCFGTGASTGPGGDATGEKAVSFMPVFRARLVMADPVSSNDCARRQADQQHEQGED